MSLASIMVHVELAEPRDDRIRLAAGLALRFHSTLIGITAWEPRPPLTYGGVVVDSDPTASQLQEMLDRLSNMGERFRATVGRDQPVEWRAGIESPTEFLVREARAADLVIIGRDRVPGDLYRTLDSGAVILRTGRPVLVVPSGVDSLKAERVVIGWKDTREARRAIRDSLPLIREAQSVVIVEVVDVDDDETPAQEHIDDVARYLARHEVAVTVKTTEYSGGSDHAELLRIAQEVDADLIVTGAYGHSRLGELIFGGVTRGLLSKSPVCCLMSH
jgi:nucleotide-binding universal stress UspA family protein